MSLLQKIFKKIYLQCYLQIFFLHENLNGLIFLYKKSLSNAQYKLKNQGINILTIESYSEGPCITRTLGLCYAKFASVGLYEVPYYRESLPLAGT